MKELKKGTMQPRAPKSLAQNFVDRVVNRVLTKIVADSPEFIPVYQTKGSACCDLRANIPANANGERKLFIYRHQTVKIDCGFSLQMPAGFEAQIRARSGLSSNSVIATNASITEQGIIHPNASEEPGGTIDSDFSLRIMALLTNVGKTIVTINHLDRIAQMAIKPVWYFDFESVQELDPIPGNDRTGGFGSTGKI